MKNVDTILKAWIGEGLLRQLGDFLRTRDPEFSALEAACPSSAAAQPLLDLRQRQMNVGLTYALWQGLRLNLENFRTGVGSLLLAQDYSQLVREHILFSLSAYSALQQELNEMDHGLTGDALEAVNELYAYWETVGLKVAHYWGFQLGNLLYPMTEPGYVPDTGATQTYRMELEEYLGISLS